MLNFFVNYIDLPVNVFLNNHNNSFFELLAKYISAIADVEVLILISIILSIYFFFNKRLKSALIMLFSVGSTAVVVTLMKDFFMRVRPENTFEAIVGNPSFPSGHASMSAAFFIALMVVFLPKIKTTIGKIWFVSLSTAAIIAIGFSRLILSVHWATDVIFGWTVGTFLALISIFVVKKFRK